MDYVTLGRSGLKVSRLCLGCMSFGNPGDGLHPWILSADDARPFFQRAIAAGINFFDTANMYSNGASEIVTGRWLKEFLPRDQAVIATKVFFPVEGSPTNPTPNISGLSRKHIMAAIDASLKRLGTDYHDLYQIHRFDRNTPIEETMEALHDVVKSGKARYIGASTMHAYQFVEMQYVAKMHGWTPFVSMQNLYNLAWREEERQMNDFCIRSGVGLMPWSPQAGGFLTTDWRKTNKQHSARSASNSYAQQVYGTLEDYQVLDALIGVATELDKPIAQVALAWVLSRAGVSAPIIGATKIQHLEDAIAALTMKLAPAQLDQLDKAYVWPRLIGTHR
ncbi:MAG: aldo/keto reductase [Spongiibacteraceae bacterium]